MMHIGIANQRWWEKRPRHSRSMRNPKFYVSGKRSMAYQRLLFHIDPYHDMTRETREGFPKIHWEYLYNGLHPTKDVVLKSLTVEILYDKGKKTKAPFSPTHINPPNWSWKMKDSQRKHSNHISKVLCMIMTRCESVNWVKMYRCLCVNVCQIVFLIII